MESAPEAARIGIKRRNLDLIKKRYEYCVLILLGRNPKNKKMKKKGVVYSL